MPNSPTPTDSVEPIRTALEFGTEVILPGGSNLVKGDLKNGALYAIAGWAARVAFGLPGLLLVSASSFTKASTGRHLHEHLGFSWPCIHCHHDHAHDNGPSTSNTN